MKLHIVEYPTEAMARAFMQGVELAANENMSAHEPQRIADGQWVVYIHVWNQEGDQVCPVCIESYGKLYGAEKAEQFARALREDLGGS
jgi:hypothetical protein